jgi:hypothetical protein
MEATQAEQKMMPLSRIIRVWWPLAASWFLMGIELPAVTGIIARLPDPEIHLAAYGGVVFPLSLIIEAPIIMLLAASTALSKDWASYLKLRRFMMAAGGGLTLLHVLIAFTPLYYFVVEGILNAPQEIVAPARIGLMIMTPWTWSIAYRRFNQGVMIRFGYSRLVGVGTLIRLGTNAVVLAIGYLSGDLPGIIVGASAVATAVVAESAFIGFAVRPVLRNELRQAPPVKEPVTLRGFLVFYIPLALTSLLLLVVQPMGSAAINRMPMAISSLAAWPAVSGLIFMLRSVGMAFNEVVVALLDEPSAVRSLQKFSLYLASITTIALAVVVFTPISSLWFERVMALSPELTHLAESSLWFGLLLPGLNVYQSWYQGAIVNGRHTRGITEAVVIYLLSSAVLLAAGVLYGRIPGIYVAMGAYSLSMLAQTIWLWYRSQVVLVKLAARDEQPNQP